MRQSYGNPKNKTFENWQELEAYIQHEEQYDDGGNIPLDFGLYRVFHVVDIDEDGDFETNDIKKVLEWAKKQSNYLINFRFGHTEEESQYKHVDHWTVSWDVPDLGGHGC